MGFVKMAIMDNLKNDSINYEVSKLSTVALIGDAMAGFSKLKDVVSSHKAIHCAQEGGRNNVALGSYCHIKC